jgi:peptidoglycan/LPS O-acetylase OafA/YrhL
MHKRFNTLDGLRGIAALAVMLAHFTNNIAFQFFSFAPIRMFLGSPLAVDLFFCLSGFVIAYAYQTRLQSGMTIRGFITRRVVRLYPMFLIGMVLGVIALALKLMTGQTDFNIFQASCALLLNIFYLPYFNNHYVEVASLKEIGVLFPLNNPAWSLFFEFIANIAFAIWALKRPKHSVLILVILSGVLLTIYVLITKDYTPGWGTANVIGGLPRAFYGFFSGVYLYLFLDKLKLYLPSIHPVLICFALTLFLFKQGLVIVGLGLVVLGLVSYWLFSKLSFFCGFQKNASTSTSISLTLIFGAFALLCALVVLQLYAHHVAVLFNLLFLVPALVAAGAISNTNNQSLGKAFDYLGWISYPIYCIHFPVYSIYTSLIFIAGVDQSSLSLMAGVFFCTVVTIALAHFVAKTIDEPSRTKLIKKLFQD